MMPDQQGTESVAALSRALVLLGSFSAERPMMTLAEAAALLDLPRSTMRRTLHTLVSLGFLLVEGRACRLAPRVLELASPFLGADPVPTILQPACDRLLVRLGTACSIGVLDGDHVLAIARAIPANWLSAREAAQYGVPATGSALGRMLLAGLPEPALAKLLAASDPPALTSRTITGRPALLDAIAAARREGFAFTEQETELGFRALAVPLRRFDGRIVAALGVSARIETVSTPVMLVEMRAVLDAEAALLRDQII